MTRTIYVFGPFELSAAERVLRRDGSIIPVPPRALGLLLVLVEARGQVVSKADLLDAVWPGSFVEEANLSQAVFTLRKLFVETYGDNSPIETVTRVGYLFRAPLRVETCPVTMKPNFPGVPSQAFVRTLEPDAREPDALQPDVPEADAGMAGQPASQQGGLAVLARADATSKTASSPEAPFLPKLVPAPLLQTRLRVALLISLCAVVCLVVGFAVNSHRRAQARRRTQPRIAVLAFRDLSGDPESHWLSPALRELLSSDLAANASLSVIPPETVERAERELALTRTDGLSPESLKAICRNLDCDDVLTGSYLVANGQLRVDTRLFDAALGTMMEHTKATMPNGEVLVLVDNAGRSVLAGLGQPVPTASGATALGASASSVSAAYRLYVEGAEEVRALNGKAAKELSLQSVALDPKFPLAHFELSQALALVGEEKASLQQIRQAKALAGSLPREDQLRIEALLQSDEGDPAASAATYGTLFSFFPDKINYGLERSTMLRSNGQTQEALQELLRLLQDSPAASHNPDAYKDVADCYTELGDPPGSLLWAQKGEVEAQKRGAPIAYGRLLTTESQALKNMHQLPLALERTKQALAIALQYGDISGQLRALNRLGEIDTAMGHLAEAEVVLRQALEQEEAIGELHRSVHTLDALSINYLATGQPEQALFFAKRQFQVARAYNHRRYIVAAELNVALAEVRIGDRHAREDLEHVSTDASALNDKEMKQKATEELADLINPRHGSSRSTP